MEEKLENHSEPEENYDPEAEPQCEFNQIYDLPEIPLITGEENEQTLCKFRVKLYRWTESELKERGSGDLKFLKHIQSNKIRILMRQDKTLKVVANFLILKKRPFCELTRLKTNEKSWVWTCYDGSEEKPSVERLCGRFVSVEEFRRF